MSDTLTLAIESEALHRLADPAGTVAEERASSSYVGVVSKEGRDRRTARSLYWENLDVETAAGKADWTLAEADWTLAEADDGWRGDDDPDA